jgi:hypothetical protein
VSTTCHRCGAVDPTGTQFRSERIPFRGTRVYCPKCHAGIEERFIIGILLIIVVFGLMGVAFLLSSPSSEPGHVYVNLFLLQLVLPPSVLVHEYAHAIVGKLAGLNIPRIWIGRGKTFYRAKFLGFDTEFKMVPAGGFTFFTHGHKENLRFRYFLAILAGPLVNAIILAIAWRFISWRGFSLETSLQPAVFIAFAQIVILIENLSPYRIQSALGKLQTDGLSLLELVTSKSPRVLNSGFGSHFDNA